MVLDVDNLALLYFDLILEFHSLRFELLHFLLIFFISGLVSGGLLLRRIVRLWRRLGR